MKYKSNRLLSWIINLEFDPLFYDGITELLDYSTGLKT
jgi:hypothetical protein